jgi:hypothetical protein
MKDERRRYSCKKEKVLSECIKDLLSREQGAAAATS